jgi:lipid A 4'-phosphatase
MVCDMATALVAAFVLAAAVFTLAPQIDIAVSGLFFRPGAGFTLINDASAVWLRWLVWRLSEAMVALAVTGLVAGAFGRWLAGIDPRRWVFVVMLYLLGPGLLVDGFLKRFSGRARPADIAEFGGHAQFTPALEFADQCRRNCSFVSGEGAASVAFALALVVLVRDPALGAGRTVRRAAYALAAAVALTGSSLRIVTGRHFMSDSVMAAHFILALGFLLWLLFLREGRAWSLAAAADGR